MPGAATGASGRRGDGMRCWSKITSSRTLAAPAQPAYLPPAWTGELCTGEDCMMNPPGVPSMPVIPYLGTMEKRAGCVF